MKWYSENNKKMLDLDSINGYVYIEAKDYVDNNSSASDVNDFKLNGDKLELIIGGSVYVFRGDTATEIFSLLSKPVEKELIKGKKKNDLNG